MLFTVNPVLSNKCKDMKGFLSNSTVLMASICAVGNPLLSPQDASSPSLLSPTPFILSCVPSTDQSIKRFLSSLFWLLLPQFYTNSSSSNLRVETQAVNLVFSLHCCSGIFACRFARTPVSSDSLLAILVLKLHCKVFDSWQLKKEKGDSPRYIVGLRSWDISHKIFFFVLHISIRFSLSVTSTPSYKDRRMKEQTNRIPKASLFIDSSKIIFHFKK